MIVKARRLPAGFAFPITRRVLKDCLRPFSDHVDVVELGGISSSEKSLDPIGSALERWFWIGLVDATWSEGRCQFRVKIEGVRRERIETLSELIGRLIARDITQFIERTLSLGETDPARGRAKSCFLRFILGADGQVESKSSVSEWD